MLETIVAADMALAEGFQASITSAERFLFLMEKQGVVPEELEKAKLGLAMAREVGNVVEHDARLMAAPEKDESGG